MLFSEGRAQVSTASDTASEPEADCLYALISGRRSVSRRNRASWYLRQLNKLVKCDSIDLIKQDDETSQTDSPEENSDEDRDGGRSSRTPQQMGGDEKDIFLVSMSTSQQQHHHHHNSSNHQQNNQQPGDTNQRYLVTPETRALFLSKSIATSIILDLSPSIVSVSAQNDCVFLDSMFDALKRVLHLLVKQHDLRGYTLSPKVFVSVIAYTPFVAAANNQVLIQNRRISEQNIEQVLVELWISMNRLIQELHELVTNTCGLNLEYESTKLGCNAFVSGGVIRHPGSVLEDIYDLGLFSSALMPRLSRLSIVVITDGLFASSNNLYAFRLRSIALSFISLATESVHPDACFGYTTYTDLMRFVAKSTQGVYISHQDLIASSCDLSKTKQIPLLSNPFFKLFSWTLHSDMSTIVNDERNHRESCSTPKAGQSFNQLSSSSTDSYSMVRLKPENIVKLFCIDQPLEVFQSMGPLDSRYRMLDPDLIPSQNYHDWRSFKQLSKNLDADFEQVLACLLREGYLIKSVQVKHRETSSIVAQLVLYWKHNVTLEQELTAPYWSADPFDLSDSNNLILKHFLAPSYGDTHCQVNIHGSYNFLHDFYCEKKAKRRSEYRALSYKQFEALIVGVKQTYDKLQYLSRFYRDSNLSKVPSFLLHGNSLLFEQPHSHNLTSNIDNVVDKTHQAREFSDYWQEVARLDQRNWRNLMHTHTLRLILEHDQPKHKNIHCQNANGRFTHIQCRRAMSAISTFIKGYASFALLEDSLYVKLVHNKEDDLREIETSSTKGFIVIKIKKLLPIVVIYLMFTSGILDSHRVQIVAYIERQLAACRLRNTRVSTAGSVSVFSENVLKSKIVYSSGDACCVQIRSPLERMLRIYSRNTLNEFLAQNLTHGLPGSCLYTNQLHHQQPQPRQQQQLAQQQQQQASFLHPNKEAQVKRVKPVREYEQPAEELPMESSGALIARYDPVFGKYLYGIRLVHTISGLPHDLVQPIVLNVLAKISAILVNVRIKQGFHIAYNKSGLLTLVAELTMCDLSHDFHSSNCLCQYLAFPPAVTNCGPQLALNGQPGAIIGGANEAASAGAGFSSKSGSLSGSLGNSESGGFIRPEAMTMPGGGGGGGGDSSPTIQADNQGEVKVIREYWIEQQYGLSCPSERYHRSLENMRYSEVVDHLYQTDVTIFDCLLTYDLLQLLCDRMSPFYELDMALSRAESRSLSVLSPTTSTSSSVNLADQSTASANINGLLPSNLIDGNTKDGIISRIPLIELDYKFSLLNFLGYCQFASLDVLLFLDRSEFFEPPTDLTGQPAGDLSTGKEQQQQQQQQQQSQQQSGTRAHDPQRGSRKMSMELEHSNEPQEHARREHRSSYDSSNATTFNFNYLNPIYSPSLNHLFLETLHKRLKQMHDKELRLTELDRPKLAEYLRKRKLSLEFGEAAASEMLDEPDKEASGDLESINWRCFMRKGNQENLLIVLVPSSLADIAKWIHFVEQSPSESAANVCPIFIFRCSSTMVNDQVLAFLHDRAGASSPPKAHVQDSSMDPGKLSLIEKDIVLHFGRPGRFLGKLRPSNDELENEILPLNKYTELAHLSSSDEKTLELVHFRAFLRKIKNTVLKSRFSSLNDAYLSELFVHKDDIQYYITNVDSDTQKKYHVSSHLRNLAEFIRNYEEYRDSLPKDKVKPSNALLNSILLQKCGLFINQPMARFNDANPLMKQLHDRKLLFMMRCNYKVELPMLEENLSKSTFLRKYVKWSPSSQTTRHSIATTGSSSLQSASVLASAATASNLSASSGSTLVSSWGRNEPGTGARLMEMRCGGGGGSQAGSVGTASMSGSPAASAILAGRSHQAPRFGPTAATVGANPGLPPTSYSPSAGAPPMSVLSPSNESFFLEAFKNVACSIEEVMPSYLDTETLDDICLRHEAHMAQVLKRKGERKESHHYRRVLKSKANYNQSHSAIDQALKRVDSLGRLEHFCLTPLLFSPAWRSKLAPVRDHTIEASSTYHRERDSNSIGADTSEPKDENQGERNETCLDRDQPAPAGNGSANQSVKQERAEEDLGESERWHQTICQNYIREYEQYIQTLGFNSVQVRYPSGSRLQTSMSTSSGFGRHSGSTNLSKSARKSSLQVGLAQQPSRPGHKRAANLSQQQRRESLVSPSNLSSSSVASGLGSVALNPGTSSAASATSQAGVAPYGNYNTSYLIKFLNSGCLVFKVGFCKPYVYSILYSIEGERFNNSSLRMNMTAFLDELDSIKVTLHLHSFTYDYHLRSMFSYISRRQMNFMPGYHLISFVDDFRKYYQKAPNYARNHVLNGEVMVTNLRVNGQQLYNYIVTHNSVYQLDVLEMADATSLRGGTGGGSSFTDDDSASTGGRKHANDYVLIELKREKVRYKDGKDPDIFECGLLIAHDHQKSNKNCLVLKYFLLLTNQRDLYPKLVHAGDRVMTLGCHRPIRLGLVKQAQQMVANFSAASGQTLGGIRRSASMKSAASSAGFLAAVKTAEATAATASAPKAMEMAVQAAPPGSTSTTATDLDDMLHSSEFLSSGELSGPQSIISTVNSIQSSNSAGLQAALLQQQPSVSDAPTITSATDASTSSSIRVAATAKALAENQAEMAADALAAEELAQESGAITGALSSNQSSTASVNKSLASVDQSGAPPGDASLVGDPNLTVPKANGSKEAPSGEAAVVAGDVTICDEEITYLGYFSSDEMDMLRFLQGKTAQLRQHLERVIRTAEVHYRRDHLWRKLMQRQHSRSPAEGVQQTSKSLTASLSSSSANNDSQLPLTNDELVQLLQIVEAIDLTSLDPSLATFTSMHINWYLKLLKAFSELKQQQQQAGANQQQQHRIFTIKMTASKTLLLYIDPKCAGALILLSINSERGSVEMSMLFKDKQECRRRPSACGAAGEQPAAAPSPPIELEPECQQLIGDFINFCAAFMWSSLLA